MKKYIMMFFVALFFCDAVVAKSPIELKIISYNIRTLARDGKNSWPHRRHATKNMLYREAPDAFGLQEATVTHLHYIDSVCPQYARVGVGRDDGKMGGEIMAIYYNTGRFDLLDSGTFWLSETPSLVSRGWDAACFRTTTWVKLRDRKSGYKFYFFNTHFDHKGRVAQTESVKLIVDKIKSIAGKKATVILTGDFNIEPGNDIFVTLNDFMGSARLDAPVTDAKGSFNQFGRIKRKCILDYIFYRGKRSECLKFRTLDGDYGAPFISDHYPIEAVFHVK